MSDSGEKLSDDESKEAKACFELEKTESVDWYEDGDKLLRWKLMTVSFYLVYKP